MSESGVSVREEKNPLSDRVIVSVGQRVRPERASSGRSGQGSQALVALAALVVRSLGLIWRVGDFSAATALLVGGTTS
jgi:hypothetical protein